MSHTEPAHLEEARGIVSRVRDDLEHLAQRAIDYDTPEGYIDTVQVCAHRLEEAEKLLRTEEADE